MAAALRVLTFLALVLAPLGMMRSHSAAPVAAGQPAAHHGADTAGHCADRDQPSQPRDTGSIDCTIACSGVASPSAAIVDHPVTVARPVARRLMAMLHGLNPESDPPPPRFA